MNTDSLIDLLARDAGPAPRSAVSRRLVPMMVLGLAFSSALALGVVGPLPSVVFQTPVPWIKLAYASVLAVSASVLTARLARPVSRTRGPGTAVAGTIFAMAILGLIALAETQEGARVSAVLGKTWLFCPWMLMGLSLPTLAGILWAVKGLAPTKPRQAGFASGLLAGSIGTVGYSLACAESSMTFVAVWYTAGIGLTGLVGGALGPRVLRW